MTDWAVGTNEMVGVEFLPPLGSLDKAPQGHFLFAPLKVRDCHGGPGRAIVLW